MSLKSRLCRVQLAIWVTLPLKLLSLRLTAWWTGVKVGIMGEGEGVKSGGCGEG